MSEANIQTVSNESGETTAVIVPIELWREIESEREMREFSAQQVAPIIPQSLN